MRSRVDAVDRLRSGDINAAVAIHCAAFKGFFLTELGPRFLRTYYRAFLGHPDAITVVARAGAEPVGFVVGAFNPRGFYRRLLRARWWAFGLAALPAILARPKRLRQVLRGATHPRANPEGAGTVGLFSIAVAPDQHGGGVGRQLIDAFVDEARARGGSNVWLTTDASGNDAVNRFYQSRGFRLLERFETPEGRAMNAYELRIDAVSDLPADDRAHA